MKLTDRLQAWLGESGAAAPSLPAPSRALAWVRDHELPTGGIAVHASSEDAYPEVTGYLVPTLLDYGEQALAHRLTRWLVCVQRADGSFTSPEGEPHVFDTGQVLRGLLSAIDVPGARDAAIRAADYLCAQTIESGDGGFGDRYAGDIPESVHLYVLPALANAARTLGTTRYDDVAQRACAYYASHPDALDPAQLTHFLAYEADALIELGRADLAKPALDAVFERQRDDGAVPGRGGVDWVCTPGLAQLAICGYALGHPDRADLALDWLERHQTTEGGFPGSVGPGAEYFPDAQPAWAVKFFLDAHRLRVESFFERNADVFPSEVDLDDGRAVAVISRVKPGDRVLEVGCGKGRFLRAVHDAVPTAECVGVDLSPTLLGCVPDPIAARVGTLERIPGDDAQFDVVFSVEAIEHSANPSAALREMVRVVKPGGEVIVVDKQRSEWGRLETPSWERWPDADGLCAELRRHCDDVAQQTVSYDGHDAADRLMVAWSGRRRSRLTGADWHRVLLSGEQRDALVQRVRRNKVSPWAREVLLATRCGEEVLEIGCGTGEISLLLAQAGRRVTVVDTSAESLEFVRTCAAELGLEVGAIEADATGRLPFDDCRFACTWSSGLLEHFESEQRRSMLREWARVTDGRLIDIVPNAACLAYRAGKDLQERRGRWIYGLEMPLQTQRDDFAAAGLRVVAELSVGARHALEFLERDHPLRASIESLMEEMSPEAIDDLHQGYLLVTIGAT